MSKPPVNSSSRKIMVIAGEPSGDKQAALLLARLRKLRPGWTFFGIGGPQMIKNGFEKLVGIEDLAVMGFAGVVGKFFYFRRVFNEMVRVLEERRPDAVILVDYPGFNLRFAGRAKQRGFRVLYYIAPQVWAWGEGRVEKLRRFVDLLVVLFPFEKEYFSERGVAVKRVGHPLLDEVKPSLNREEYRAREKIETKARLIALLPGSRPDEVDRHLPVLLAAVAIMADQHEAPIVPVIARASGITHEKLHDIAERAGFAQPHISTDVYSTIAAADLALVKSGTGTVECAMLGTPFVVMYKTGIINYQIARRLVKTKHIAMVNLIAGKTIVPEFIQRAATPANLAHAAGGLLTNKLYRETLKGELQRVRERLGSPGGAAQAAHAVIDWLEGPA